jgi:hypothetical protein
MQVVKSEISLKNSRTRQIRNVLGLSAIHGAQSTSISMAWELPLPTRLPYDSEIFVHVQNGDLEATYQGLYNRSAHINVVDPYGLGLLYVSYSSFEAITR